MAGTREIKCIGPSAYLPDRKAAVQRSVNMYLSQISALGEDKQVILQSVPGLVQMIDFGANERGRYATESREFVVAGQTLYETTTGVAVARGTIAGTGPVGMQDGTDQLVIVTGEFGYVLRLASNLLQQITSPNWRGSYSVGELNGLFIFIALDQPDQFYLSKIDDATDLDILDFSSADAQPDSLLTQTTLKQEAYFFGTLSTEVWAFVADGDFPMQRYTSTPIDIGIVGRYAVVNAADTLVFVGRTERGTGIVYLMAGHQPQRISSESVEAALQADGVDLTGCTMWTWQGVGLEFVGINAPGMETTWVWDASTGEWHEQAELVDGHWEPMRIERVTSIAGDHHASSGRFQYRISEKTFNLAGDVLARERTWPHLMSASMEPVTYAGLEIACSTGSGGNVTLEVSNDGGFTFGPPLLRGLGAVGRWMERVRWNFLGQARDRVFRLRCTDDVPFNIHAATIDAR